MKTRITLAVSALILTIWGCKKNDVTPEQPSNTNAQELITTVILKGHNHDDPSDSLHWFTYKWEDLDGAGGNAPSFDTLALDTGIEYHVHVLILDKSKTPFDTISKEIYNERNVHQFFYTLSSELNGKVSTEILDFDTNNPALPVGLEFHLVTTSDQSYPTPVNGSLRMLLSHYDGVPKTTSPSAESDLDISIPLRLK